MPIGRGAEDLGQVHPDGTPCALPADGHPVGAGGPLLDAGEELVRSIVQPILDEEEAFLIEQEALDEVEPRALLEGYFDFHYRHRREMVLMLSELTTLADLGLIDRVMDWRGRLTRLLHGPEPTLEQATRAAIAVGDLQDCTIQFADVPEYELRRAAVDGACAALGIEP